MVLWTLNNMVDSGGSFSRRRRFYVSLPALAGCLWSCRTAGLAAFVDRRGGLVRRCLRSWGCTVSVGTGCGVGRVVYLLWRGGLCADGLSRWFDVGRDAWCGGLDGGLVTGWNWSADAARLWRADGGGWSADAQCCGSRGDSCSIVLDRCSIGGGQVA